MSKAMVNFEYVPISVLKNEYRGVYLSPNNRLVGIINDTKHDNYKCLSCIPLEMIQDVYTKEGDKVAGVIIIHSKRMEIPNGLSIFFDEIKEDHFPFQWL